MWVPRYFDRSYWTERFWPSGAGGSGTEGIALPEAVTADASSAGASATGYANRGTLTAAHTQWRSPATAVPSGVHAVAISGRATARGGACATPASVLARASMGTARAVVDTLTMILNDEDLLLLLDLV